MNSQGFYCLYWLLTFIGRMRTSVFLKVFLCWMQETIIKGKMGMGLLVSLTVLQFSINKPHCVCRAKQCLCWIRRPRYKACFNIVTGFPSEEQHYILSKFINSGAKIQILCFFCLCQPVFGHMYEKERGGTGINPADFRTHRSLVIEQSRKSMYRKEGE